MNTLRSRRVNTLNPNISTHILNTVHHKFYMVLTPVSCPGSAHKNTITKPTRAWVQPCSAVVVTSNPQYLISFCN